jgi:hypothetical protein
MLTKQANLPWEGRQFPARLVRTSSTTCLRLSATDASWSQIAIRRSLSGPLVARSRSPTVQSSCRQWGAKRTCHGHRQTEANDPLQTLANVQMAAIVVCLRSPKDNWHMRDQVIEVRAASGTTVANRLIESLPIPENHVARRTDG